MPPKSSTAPPSSRRSARLQGTTTTADAEEVEQPSKKRETTGEPNSAAKKTKTETDSEAKETNGTKSKTAPAPESKPKAKEAPKSKSKSESKEQAAKEEKKAEAPASAKSSGKTLGKGDKLPKIKLEDQEGAEVDVSTLAGEDTGIVIFLYPKADTPGCTSQACGFRDHFDQIKELGYQVYGLSKDKPAAQKKWQTKKELNYSLLCDPESKLIKRLGAFVQPNNTKRSHFIFEKGSGKLVDIALGVKPADDPKNCLDFIKKHHS